MNFLGGLQKALAHLSSIIFPHPSNIGFFGLVGNSSIPLGLSLIVNLIVVVLTLR